MYDSIAISIPFPLSVCDHLLFVCVLYTGTDGVVYDGEWIYLAGYLWKKKKENGYLMEIKKMGVQPIGSLHTSGMFLEHSQNIKDLRQALYSEIYVQSREFVCVWLPIDWRQILLFRFQMCSWNVMGTQTICVIFVSVFYMLFVRHTLTVMYVLWLIWFVHRFCVNGMLWIHFYLYCIPFVCMYSLIVCLWFICRYRRRRSWWRNYLFEWMFMRKKK